MLTDNRLKALIRLVCRRRGIPKEIVDEVILEFANFANEANMGVCIEGIARRGAFIRLESPLADSILMHRTPLDNYGSDPQAFHEEQKVLWATVMVSEWRLDFSNCEVPHHKYDLDCLSDETMFCRSHLNILRAHVYRIATIGNLRDSVRRTVNWISRLYFADSVYHSYGRRGPTPARPTCADAGPAPAAPHSRSPATWSDPQPNRWVQQRHQRPREGAMQVRNRAIGH